MKNIFAVTTNEIEIQQGTLVSDVYTGKPELKYIDFDGLVERTEGDTGLMIALIDIYLEHSPIAISNMRAYYARQDWDALANEAHSFKPTPVYFGLHLQHQNAIKIEKLAKQKSDPIHFAELVKEIEINAIYVTKELTLLKNFFRLRLNNRHVD